MVYHTRKNYKSTNNINNNQINNDIKKSNKESYIEEQLLVKQKDNIQELKIENSDIISDSNKNFIYFVVALIIIILIIIFVKKNKTGISLSSTPSSLFY